MNNAVFGKTLENLRKRINLKLTNNEDIYTKHASRANFISGKMFNENSFAINRIKKMVLNRQIYVGMAILDLSKNYKCMVFIIIKCLRNMSRKILN